MRSPIKQSWPDGAMGNRFGGRNGVDFGPRVGSVRRRLARRSLKPQLNQIRTWVRQGRTDAWIAHQLDVSVKDISAFKREHDLAPADGANGGSDAYDEAELDLRAEDDALVAAALEAEQESDEDADGDDTEAAEADENGDGDDAPKRRRRG